jgi:hypothetical protein
LTLLIGEDRLILIFSHKSVQGSVNQRRSVLIYLLILWAILMVFPAYGTNYYVSSGGSDYNAGSISSPYKTVGKAVTMAAAGDTIYLRGGQHDYSATIAIITSGTAEKPITLKAFGTEEPILDFTLQPDGDNYKGMILSGSYWHLKGFVIQYAGHNGLLVRGSHNVVEQLVTRSNGDTGLHLSTGALDNLVLNCDSYFNYDPEENGQDADGFGAKFTTGQGNIFRGCRSWNNSDDGYDCWEAGNGVTFEDCWAFRNGDNIWNDPAFTGNANGFKLGHGGGAHVLIRCLAFDHRVHGIDVNGNTTGVTIYNCICAGNHGRNFYFDEHSASHVLRNNLSYPNSLVTIYDEIDDTCNSWNGAAVTDADFASLDSSGIDGPRQPDGGLPRLAFLRLSAASPLIDAGIDVGQAFESDAPDLGAFEWLAGDCVPDGFIDLADLECFVARWLNLDCGICGGADFDGNSRVTLYDFKKLAGNWLTGKP